MNAIESPDGRIDMGALWQALEELEAAELGPQRRDALMELVGRSPAAQRAYLEYFEMTAMLEEEASTHAEQGKLPKVYAQGWLAFRRGRRSVLAVAAIVLIAAISAALVVLRQSRVERFAVSATAGARWSIDGVVQDPAASNWQVAAGSTVKVLSGTVELKLASGVAYVMQGPARASFSKPDRPRLHDGWLWVDSEESAKPVVVETPELQVRDIGTRFAVRVGKDQAAEVHLIEGKVDVFSKETRRLVASLAPENGGVSISASEDLKPLQVARDPFPELAELMEGPASYATVVRSQSPVGYWRMNERESEHLVNEVAAGSTGRRHPDVVTNERGPRQEDGYSGLGEDNRAVFITGGTDTVPLSLGSAPVHQGLIYQEDFHGVGALNGSTPRVSMDGAKWVASPIFQKDGSVGREIGSATLAFDPVDGVIYTLDATVTARSGASEDWIGLGFTQGQVVTAARFQTSGLAGRAWMLHRAADTTKPVNRAWMSGSGSDWVWPTGSPLGGTVEMRIVLDTTGGAGTWTATWLAKRPDEKAYRVVRETEKLINESIDSVGLAAIGRRISASVEKFSLRADRKEPIRDHRNLADGPADVARREGAVSCWFRRQPGPTGKQTIWAAGEGMLDESITTHITADGRIGFFMENGRYDVLIASDDPVDDGKWHHLVASWSPSSVDLYLDGEIVARDSDLRGQQQGSLPEFRFGGDPEGGDRIPFAGWVDEIALWERALTAVEVNHQFQAAVGNPR